jgi:hypothetical protein
MSSATLLPIIARAGHPQRDAIAGFADAQRRSLVSTISGTAMRESICASSMSRDAGEQAGRTGEASRLPKPSNATIAFITLLSDCQQTRTPTQPPALVSWLIIAILSCKIL